VIDKKIPYISSSANITVIEKAATEGIIDLKRYLLETLS
jgi:hypothetical protein